MADIARIEERLDRIAVGNTAVSDSIGGIAFQNMTEVMEFAKLMSLSGNSVPKHLQGNPGMCLAVCVQAMEWRFSPFAVANKSYEVQNRLSFESQLVHAVIEQRAPIIGRLRFAFEGEGDERVCIVSAKLRETGEMLEYRSPPFNKITPKNSPLWKTKPDLQLYYNTSRDFCRAYFPDVLLGVYSQEELRDHVGPDNAKDVNDRPSVGQRLKAKGQRGFNASHVERETRGGVVEETEVQREARGNVPADARTGDEPKASAKEPSTDGSGAVQDRMSESTAPTDSNSSQPDSSPAEAAMKPAAEQAAADAAAGNQQSSELSPADEEAQAGSSPPAGLPSTPEVSDLSPDWQETYLRAMARVTDRPKSLTGRHSEALQLIGGKANPSEQEWMKAVYRLTERRLRCEITKDECDAAIKEIS